MSYNFLPVLSSVAMQFATIAVCVVGLILALVQLQRMPRVAALVAAGLGLMLLAAILQPLVQLLLPAMTVSPLNRRRGSMNLSLVYMASALLFNILRAVALGLLAWAAFV